MEELITAIIEQALVDYATDHHKEDARWFLERQTLVDIDLKPIMGMLDKERGSHIETAPITYRLMDHLYA